MKKSSKNKSEKKYLVQVTPPSGYVELFQKAGMKTTKSKDGTITNKFINKQGNTVIQVKTKDGRYYEKVVEPQIKPLDNTSRYQNALLNNPAVVADNTRVANADFAADAMANRGNVARAVAAEKKAQYEFEKNKWDYYNKQDLANQIGDRAKAFMVDPLGMVSRFVSGEQAYIPGMGDGLINYEDPNRDRYLKAVGYTPGKFEASDIQNMVNPAYWGASIGSNMKRGNYGTAAVEAALTFAPFLPKGSGRLVKQGAGMLADDITKGIKTLDTNPRSWFQTPEQRLYNKKLYESLFKNSSSWDDPLGKLYEYNDLRKLKKASKRESKALVGAIGDAEQVKAIRENLGEKSFNNVLNRVQEAAAARRLRRSNLPIQPILTESGTRLGGGNGVLYMNKLNPEEAIKVGYQSGNIENLEKLVSALDDMKKAGVQGIENVGLPRKVLPLNFDPIAYKSLAVEFQPWLGSKLDPNNPVSLNMTASRLSKGDIAAKEELLNLVKELDKRQIGIDYPHNNILFDPKTNSYKLIDLNYTGDERSNWWWNYLDIPAEQRLVKQNYLTQDELDLINTLKADNFDFNILRPNKPAIEKTITFYHGGLDPNATLDDIDIFRLASRQQKKGRDYAGFYMSPDINEGSFALNYHLNNPSSGLHKIELPGSSKAYKYPGSMERIKKSELEKLKSQGYDYIEGTNLFGQPEFVLLNKDNAKLVPVSTAKPSSHLPIGQAPGGTFADGGEFVVKDQEGQRNHPGKITEIQGNAMATDGYGDIPLFVVPDNDKPKIVFPNTGTHIFENSTKFVEYPILNKTEKASKLSPTEYDKARFKVEDKIREHINWLRDNGEEVDNEEIEDLRTSYWSEYL